MKKTSIIASALVLLSTILSADITIKNGWQLLGATQDINASIFDSTCVDYIWKYDATDINNAQWQVHIANAVAYNNTMAPITSLVKGEGYWVKGNGDCNVTLAEPIILEAIVEATRYTRDDATDIVTDNNQRIKQDINGAITYLPKRMWQDDANPPIMDWYTAHQYCAEISLGGYTNWRLPLKEELKEIIDVSKYPRINSAFNNIATDILYYWSSTGSAEYPGHAWREYFYYGFDGYLSKDSQIHVRCVRAGQ